MRGDGAIIEPGTAARRGRLIGRAVRFIRGGKTKNEPIQIRKTMALLLGDAFGAVKSSQITDIKR